MLAGKASEKTITQNDRTEMLPKMLSVKLSSEISVPKCRPENDLQKVSLKISVLKCCPKIYPQKQSSKMSVPK